MKKFLAIILASMLCVSMLASCASKDDEASSAAAPNDTTSVADVASDEPKAAVEIRTVGQFGGSDPSAGAYSSLVEGFMAEYDYITVKDESATADDAWKAQVAADINSGNEPDVLMYFTDVAGNDVVGGKYVDLDTIKAEYPDYASNISDAAFGYMVQNDGKTYAVPIRGYWEGVFTNEALFTEKNIDLPTDWDKFNAAIDGFAATDIVPVAVSLGDVPHYWIEHLILAYGGVDAIQICSTIGVDTEAIPASWVDAFTAFKTLNDAGAFPANVSSTSNDEVGVLFQTSKAAMQIDGSWYCGSVEAIADDVTVLPMPAAPGSAKDPSDIVAGYSVGFYISQKAWDDVSKRDACVKFVSYVTSTEAISAYAAVGGAPADANAQPPAGSLARPAEDGAKMAAAAKNATFPTDNWLKQGCNDILRAGANDIAAGKTTDVKAMLEEAVAANA